MKIGDTITFKYFGGSNYGGARKVKLTTETAKTWGGIDLSVNEVRKYFKNKMTNVSVVELRDDFEDARLITEKFLSTNSLGTYVVESVVDAFNKKWKVNYAFTNKQLVEKPKTLSKAVLFEKKKDIKSGMITIKLGTKVEVSLDSNGHVYCNGSYVGYSPLGYSELSQF